MENQELMGQFLENRQNYMMDNNSMQHMNMNMNVASAGCGDSVVGGGVQADMVSGVGGVAGEILGVKYDEHHHEEHDVGDDDELKYVKEVQQSEKQQQQQQQQQQSLKNLGLDADDDANATYEHNEFAEKEVINASAHHFGNGDGGFVFGGDHQQEQPQQHHHHDLFNIGNGHDTNGHNDFGNTHGFEEKLNFESHDMDGFKVDADCSSSTNVTESAEGFLVPQVDVKIETKSEQLAEMQDEEEPSSLATNTTNGTSSLSENVPTPQVAAEAQSNTNNEFDDFMSNLEDKENADPLTPQRPSELDLDLNHSQLNPDAKEFIPSFGSNPASPTSPFPAGEPTNEDIILSETMETQMYFGQAPIAVPRHLLNDDDFVAQSPRKGKGDNDLDTVPLPKALAEFEKEADQRPHEPETEQRDEVMTPDQAIQQLPLDDQALDKELEQSPIADTTDFQPSSFMDHGPETCVDTDLDMQPAEHLSSLPGEDDVMKRSIYVANDEAIEDVLNSVQPIPTEIDSVNNSFIEESATESAANQLANDKELLQVEEKEHVSHSPSTEEIQMNLQNALNSSNKDIPQLPIDMDNANNMQESMYMEHQAQDGELLNTKQDLLDDKPHHHEGSEERQDMLVEKENVEVQQLHEQIEFQQHEEHEYVQEQSQQENPIDQEEHHLPEQEQFIEKPIEHKIQDLTDEVVPETYPEELLLTKEQQILEEEPIKHEEQQILDEFQSHSEQHLQDELINQTHQSTLDDFENQTEQHFGVKEDSVLIEPTSSLNANENFLDNSPVSHEQQQEIHESYSPFKISDEFTSAPILDALNVDTSEIQQQQEKALSDVLSPSSTADEKHLLEETKEEQQHQQQQQEQEHEQQPSIMSDLEQQMNEMMLSNNDGNLLQAEEIAATPAINTIEDISENVILPDEAVVVSHDQTHHEKKEPEQMLVDDSAFNQLDSQPQAELQSELEPEKEMEIEHIQEPVQEQQIEQHIVDVSEIGQIREPIESPIQQEYHQELESEMVAVEEPIIEAKQAAQLFTTKQETENETKIEEEQHVVEEKPIVEPVVEEKAIEEPLVEEKPVEEPLVEEKHVEEPLVEEKPIEEPLVEEKPIEEPLVEEKPIEEPLVEEKPIEEPLVEEKPIEEPLVEEKPIEEPLVEEKLIEEAHIVVTQSIEEPHVEEKQPVEEVHAEEKPVEEQQQEQISLSMVPETAPAELLEPPMELNKEQETKQEEQQKPIEEVVSEPIKETVLEEVKPKVEEEVKPDVAVEAAVVAVTAAVAATAAVGAKIAASPAKKTETAKKPLAKTSTTTAKPKVGTTPTAKKPTEMTKKPANLAAKPRAAAPARPASATAAAGEKKPISKTSTSTATTTARKTLGTSSVTASKTTAKSTSTMTSTTRTTSIKSAATARPTTAPRTLTSSTTTARKLAATSSTATSNGPLAKPRPGSAPAKPTTLGLSATNGAPKTKPASPRAPLTSQVRRTTTTTTTAKSPIKLATTNGVTKTTSSTLSSKTKTSSTTVTSTGSGTASKTFTARPAPKFTHSSSSTATTTTTRRLTVGGTTATSSTTMTTTKTSSTPLRKSTPTKPATARTPLKSTPTGASKSKTPITKTPSSTEKPAPIRKPVDKTIKPTNGDINEAAIKDINGTAALNGDLQAVQESQEQQQNGDTSIPMQNDEPSLLETSNRDGQIPMDVINA